MNLERVEELCLHYLGQAANPLVSLSALLEHCRRDSQCAELTMEILHDFLAHHELVHLLEAPAGQNIEEQRMLASMGIDTGPRVILVARMPSRDEIVQQIEDNLANMMQSLNTALAEAEKCEEPKNAEDVRLALSRAKALQDKFREFL